ncbi:helix-turn-helix domain-containing protein [Lentibacillus amyloliquefaciens]|uniref:HTH cro/C1-type domain-containing protein n=1 Tax=Lentibacillus amyloliquefaciens TaxID=1472767 RepID=A0A0U3W3F2_9BACI|nr:helix-turn-helix transcriptional regulator [Lentibacillus amyloliquefaciens]ALX47696.1 hypothetical protein AOX59_03210 [Lentibacillus amyloliquefaciens]
MPFNLLLLKDERTSQNISQKEMANYLGMDHASYSKRENGKVFITVEEFMKILEVLDIPEKESLFFWE